LEETAKTPSTPRDAKVFWGLRRPSRLALLFAPRASHAWQVERQTKRRHNKKTLLAMLGVLGDLALK
jgi:hypothetical protein